MAEKVVERPGLSQPTSEGLTAWAPAFIQQLLAVLQQYGHRLNRSITRDGTERMEAPLPLQSVLAADLPAASAWEGTVIYVSDGSSGAKFRGSDGTNWVNLG